MSTGVVDIDFDVFGMSLMLFRYPHIWLVGQIRPFEQPAAFKTPRIVMQYHAFIVHRVCSCINTLLNGHIYIRPGAKRLLLHRPSYVTQRESKGQLGALIRSWADQTDEQARNSILTYARSKQNKLMVHLRSQQKSRQRRNKNNGIIIMGWFMVHNHHRSHSYQMIISGHRSNFKKPKKKANAS